MKYLFLITLIGLFFSCTDENIIQHNDYETSLETRSSWCDGGQAQPANVGLFGCDCEIDPATGQEFCCIELGVASWIPDGTEVTIVISEYDFNEDEATNNGAQWNGRPYNGIVVQDRRIEVCIPRIGTKFLVHIPGFGCNEFDWKQCD